MQSDDGLRARLGRVWTRLSASSRRRILLGSLVAVSLAARDLVLLVVAASLLALSEAVPAPAPVARPSG